MVGDLPEHLLIDRELIGAEGAEVERVEGQDQLAADELAQRDGVSVLVVEREVGRL